MHPTLFPLRLRLRSKSALRAALRAAADGRRSASPFHALHFRASSVKSHLAGNDLALMFLPVPVRAAVAIDLLCRVPVRVHDVCLVRAQHAAMLVARLATPAAAVAGLGVNALAVVCAAVRAFGVREIRQRAAPFNRTITVHAFHRFLLTACRRTNRCSGPANAGR